MHETRKNLAAGLLMAALALAAGALLGLALVLAGNVVVFWRR